MKIGIKHLAVLAGAALASGIGYLWHGINRSPAAVVVDMPLDPATRNGCRLEPGQRLGYLIDVDLNGTLTGGPWGGSDGDKHATQFGAQLKLSLLTIGRDAEGAIVQAHFGADNETNISAAPFLLRIADSCDVVGFARYQQTALAAARAQQAMAYELVWRWPTNDANIHETSRGVARARYSHGADGAVTGDTESYSALWDVDAQVMSKLGAVRPETSHTYVVPGANPWFESFEHTEQLEMPGIGAYAQRTVVRSSSQLARTTEHERYNTNDFIWENLLPRRVQTRIEREVTEQDLVLRESLKHQTLAQALANHEALNRTEANFAFTWRKTSAYLEANPAAIEPFVKALQERKIADGIASGWLAVGNARVPEAKAALLAVMRDDHAQVSDRTRAMFAMVDRADVGVPFAAELGSMTAAHLKSDRGFNARQLGRESALALGMFGGLRSEADPAVIAEAKKVFTNLLTDRATRHSLHTTFRAIGNLGDKSLLSVTQPFTTNSDVKIRASAAYAMRRIRVSESADFAASWLGHEADPTVKREIYTVLSRQLTDQPEAAPNALVDRAIADVQQNPSLQTRRAIIRILGNSAQVNAAARQALIAQIPFELAQEAKKEGNGLYAAIAAYLTPAEATQGLMLGGGQP